MKLKALLFTTLLFLATPAHAQSCHQIGPGLVVINHRTGILYGGNFSAVVSCSRATPTYVRWLGSYMCPGRYFYGRTSAGVPFSCLVRQVGKR
jgi:hypothetical protein